MKKELYEDIGRRIIYEDNHLLVITKLINEPVQGDSSGDPPLIELAKKYVKQRDSKPGNVFMGLPHRLDRPTSGLLVLAKTSKALSRLGKQFKTRDVRKIYWAVVDHMPPADQGSLEHYLWKNRSQNKSYSVSAAKAEKKGAKLARLSYTLLGATDNYFLLEVELETGRHHQIRAQLAAVGCHIKGDLKYGARRSNAEGGIHLHSRRLIFDHPVKNTPLDLTAEPPADPLWREFLT